MCLSNIKDGTASRPIRSRAENIHPLTRKNTCIRAGAFFVIEVSGICNHPLFHIASAMPKEKATILKWSPPENTQTRIAFTKIQKHLEHLQYSTPPAQEHNTRIRTFTHIFFAAIFARRYNENYLLRNTKSLWRFQTYVTT